MSADKAHAPRGAEGYRLRAGSLWANAWKVMAVVAAVGAVASIVGLLADPHRFAFSYLFAFMTVLSLGLGSMFVVLIMHLTATGWGVTVRRTAEFMLFGIPIMAVLLVPVLLMRGELYEWASSHHGESEHGADHAAAGDEGLLGASKAQAQGSMRQLGHAETGRPSGEIHTLFEQMDPRVKTPMEEAEHHHLLEHKSGWLNSPFWIARSILYVLIWIFIAVSYFRWSTRQDETKDLALTVKMQRWSPVMLILFGFSLTFAAFDWLMALEPVWYSTIFGVYVFAGSVVSTFALLIVVTMGLKNDGHLGEAVSVEHYHDLGKLMFGFICFWAYIGFSQWMLIWYASIPEETTYYHWRWEGGWRTVSLLLIFGHFAAPFFFLISRVVKRRLAMLRFASLWMLALHIVDVYWFVMPYAGTAGLSLSWIDLACLLGVAGVFFTVVFFNMNRYALIPLGDPRLARSIEHYQVH